MYNGLLHAHSGLRWVVLILLLLAVINALMKMKKPFSEGDRKLNLWAMMFGHIQILIGLGLYFVSPKVILSGEMMKDAILRFYGMEHAVMMLIAVILMTIGYSKSKKAQSHKKAFIFYFIALLVIFYAIPWPWEAIAGNWF